MTKLDDQKLDMLLSTLQPAAADDALVDKIMAAAMATPQQDASTPARTAHVPYPFMRRLHMAGFGRAGVALAATAIFGFWLGQANIATQTTNLSTQPAVSESASSAGITLETVVFGPGSLDELML